MRCLFSFLDSLITRYFLKGKATVIITRNIHAAATHRVTHFVMILKFNHSNIPITNFIFQLCHRIFNLISLTRNV